VVVVKHGRDPLILYIPDELANRLGAAEGADLSLRALEGLALEEYKKGNLSDPVPGFETEQMAKYELDGFLKAHGVYEDFTMEDFEHDLADLKVWDFDRCGWSLRIRVPLII
jgi:hypothetical protein